MADRVPPAPRCIICGGRARAATGECAECGVYVCGGSMNMSKRPWLHQLVTLPDGRQGVVDQDAGMENPIEVRVRFANGRTERCLVAALRGQSALMVIEEIKALLSANGCDCSCSCHPSEHDDSCERCLGCRIQKVLGST